MTTSSPTTTTTTTPSSSSYDYDYLVIGGGSGGVSSAKRAATLYGKRVAVVEAAQWGGTCVNVGCVPKKIMYQASHIRQTLCHDARMYNFKQNNSTSASSTTSGTTTSSTNNNNNTTDHDSYMLDWRTFKEKRDRYIVRLNNIYLNGLKNAGITVLEGFASFLDNHTVQVQVKEALADGTTSMKTTIITADVITIAVGGKPIQDAAVQGMEHAIDSDGFFALTSQPKKVVVVGAGYIAVELAGVLHGLGTETHLVVRKHKALREFDDDISNFLDQQMTKDGVHIHRNTMGLAKIEIHPENGTKTITTVSGEVLEGFDVVLMAAGRVPHVNELELDQTTATMIPNTEGLGLDHTTAPGVQQDPHKKYIVVDEYQNTSVDNIKAVGDVCGKIELTPMAIAAGRRLADRLFSGQPEYVKNAKAGYDLVPTVVFSHPPIGTIGLSETKAIAKYGEANIKVYKSTFVNLHYSMFDMEPSEKPRTLYKVICAGIDEQVVGLHMIGMASDEVLQGFAVAMKMGATKMDFDSAVAIHPTAAEEMVTLGTWGTSPQVSGAKVSPTMGAPPPEPTLAHSATNSKI